MNIADKAAVVHIRAVAADTDNVSARRNANAGGFAQRNIFGAGRVGTERTTTDSRVGAGGVAKERVSAAGGVEAAGCVVTECTQTGSCVGVAGSVVKKGEHPTGR